MKSSFSSTLSLILALSLCPLAMARKPEPVTLTPTGEQLLAQYTEELKTLRAEVIAALPALDEGKKTKFVELRKKWDQIPTANDDTSPEERRSIDLQTEEIQAESLLQGDALVKELSSVLSSDKLDSKLMKIAVLHHGTPRGLAEFAQQGDTQKKLLDSFSIITTGQQ